jgi:DNA-binding response OmpR family regulator
MPQISGVQLARRARELYPGVPILFVTGYAGSELDGLDLLAPWALLKKPFGGRELMDAVEAL